MKSLISAKKFLEWTIVDTAIVLGVVPVLAIAAYLIAYGA
jgi:hypothetical protein